MDQSTQMFINASLGVIAFLGGAVMKSIWDALKKQQEETSALAAKVQNIEVLVAGSYVKTEKFEQVVTALFLKLDKIYEKLDGKADKLDCDRIHNG
jgi:hypothetical protein